MRRLETSLVAGAALSALLLTLNATAFDDRPVVEAWRADSSGRMLAVDPATPDLAHPDGDAVALVISHRATDVVPSMPAPIGPPAFTLISNGLGDEGDTPTEVVFTPDGSAIVVAHRDSRNLTIFDADTRAVLMSIGLSGSPNAVAISPDGTRAVTANIFEDTASIVDLGAGVELDVVAVGDQPGVVRIAPGGASAVVGNTVSGDLSVIDIASGVETARIAGVQFSSLTSINFESGVTVSSFTDFEFADATTLLLPERFNARVQFVDIIAETVTPLATAANPVDVAVAADGSIAAVAHGFTTQLVSVIDLAGPSVSSTIPTGVDLNAGAIALNGDATRACVGVLNEVRIVDLVSGTVSPNISTSGVNDVITTADGLYCLAVGFNGALVSYASQSLVANLNGQVSMQIGAHDATGPRAALVGQTFTEELVVVSTNGAAGFLEDRVPSGPPPEGDKARQVAVTPDSTRAVATNIFSDTLSIVDLATQTVEGIVSVGDRPSESAITPDSSRAVTANLDSSFLSVTDLDAQTSSSVNISTRASQVELSPDGQLAYAAVVASGDGVWRVNLDTLAVQGPKIPTGNMGSVFFNYQQSSGMTLSHDGATLVTCNSFDDDVSIIDTASWTELVRLPVGNNPVRAAFSPDDTRIYVTNKDDDTVSQIANLGAGSSVANTINVGDQPFEMAITPTRLFVGNFNGDSISVIDVTTAMVTATLPVSEHVQGLALNAAGDRLHVAGGTASVTIGPGPLVTINNSGELRVYDTSTLALVDQVTTGLTPGNVAVRATPEQSVIAAPQGDGLVVAGEAPCPWDLGGDGSVGVTDLLDLLADWGNPWAVNDLLDLLAAWGPCP